MSRLDAPLIKNFTNVNDFFDFISSELVTRDHSYGFRGHANASWELKPTLMRFAESICEAFPEKNLTLSSVTKGIYDDIHDNFRNNLIINADLGRNQADEIDLWQYGQHYGLPSPLLDWTYSPYVALFFALSEENPFNEEGLRCVWTLNLGVLHQINLMIEKDVWPAIRESLSPESKVKELFPLMELVKETNEKNRRISFQQGFFTKHIFYRSLEVWIKRITSELHHDCSAPPFMQKFQFTCNNDQRLEVLDRLDKMNINYRTLFPDIFGSVKDAVDNAFRNFRNPSTKNYSFWEDSS